MKRWPNTVLFLATGSWFVAIWVLSSLPLQQLPSLKIFSWDKLAHIAEYLVLAVLACRSLEAARVKRNYWVWVFLILLLSAALDEWHQKLIPHRSVSLWDFLANAIGLALGFGVNRIIHDRSSQPAA